MSVIKFVFLMSAVGALAECSFGQTFVGVDFEQLAAPSGCIRNATAQPGNAPAIPALKLSGVTLSGGQVVIYQNPFQFTSNNVYYTLNSCAGVQPTVTITFDGSAANVNMVIGQNWVPAGETVQVQDDRGHSQTVQLSNAPQGQTIFLPYSNIHTITLSLAAGSFNQAQPVGFYIDNLDFYLDNGLDFVDPVPELMSGTGIVSDPQSLATLGTLVRGVAADGVARVVLSVQATHVGDKIDLKVLNDRGNSSNSTQEDGGLTLIGDSPNSKQQSIRVTAQDSTEGPMAFAVYYPPNDFSRGSQDDQLASRNIQIQVDARGSNTPSYKRTLAIVRPPVVLVHDLWEDAADWDSFSSLVNDSRFFIRRASYNAQLGSRITAAIPTFANNNLSHARESSLGVSYNAPLVLSQITQYVNEFRAAQNIAASQADLVVHGMGGVIVRAAVQIPNYATPESYGQGSINKMITIGTPHLGTPLATSLLRNENSCFANILASAGKFSFSSATVDGASVAGGIGDLQGNGFGGGLSPALAKIQQSAGQTAPVATIAGLTTNTNTNSLDDTLGVARFIRLACSGTPLASSLSAFGWLLVFDQPGDAMVPWLSQLAGQQGSTVLGVVHSTGMDQLGFNPPSEVDGQSPVAPAVINLLNASTRSNSFNQLP